MSKFNTAVKTGVQSPVKTTGRKITNASGHVGYERDTKSELFLLAVSNFVGTDTFYESAKNRDDRFSALCRKTAVADYKWFGKFVGWLRNDAFMRSAAIVAAAEGAKALLDSGVSGTPVRALVAVSMNRADEPGEFLAYWTAKFGKSLPQSVKKGVADGAKRLYNEYSLLKYDTDSKGFRFADVIQLSHAKAKDARQNDLFGFALNRRYGNTEDVPGSLNTIRTNKMLMATPVAKRRSFLAMPESLKGAGMTWESLSGWLQGPMDKQAWEAIIPSMGYMALLRNLRNFVQAGVSQKTMDFVLGKLADPAEVAKSKQFPFRFLAAYQANKNNLKIASALEDALNASLANVPELKGKTLILVDRSGSMFGNGWGNNGLSGREELDNADKAAIFGTALALRAENATLVQYGSSWSEIKVRKGDSILTTLNQYRSLGGTSTTAAIRAYFKDHDRVIVITDEQYNGYSYSGGPSTAVPANVPMYTWNLAGYKTAQTVSGESKRHTFGGLTDKGFQMIPLIEAGQFQDWDSVFGDNKVQYS